MENGCQVQTLCQIQMHSGGSRTKELGFHKMLVLFLFALVELLGKIILHTHLADGM